VNAGEALQRLQNSWVGLVSKNYEIEQACQTKEFIKYEKTAELAQLKFIVTEAESDRSGSRIRRRVRRFFLQRRGPYHQNGQAEDKSDDEEVGQEEAEPQCAEAELQEAEDSPMLAVVNGEPEAMDEGQGQGESEPDSRESSSTSDEEDESSSRGNDKEVVEKDADEEIGPQPSYYYPDADKIENDPDRSNESESD